MVWNPDNSPTLGDIRGFGAGPGPTKRYFVDVGVPGGANVPIDVPVAAIANDFANALAPRVDQVVNGATQQIEAGVTQGVSKPIQDALASGNLVVQQASSKVSWGVIGVTAVASAFGGWIIRGVMMRRK